MIVKYGLQFSEDPNDISIELYCYRTKHSPKNGGLGPAEHLRNAIHLLWPEYDQRNRRVLVRNEWQDRRIKAFAEDEFGTWWGPAASAKSTDAAAIALADWYAAPVDTTTIICSTTIRMLRRRIFGEIVRLHNAARRIHKAELPGFYLKSQVAVLLDPGKSKDGSDVDIESEKSGIFGFAIQQGSKEEAKDNIIGQHNERVRLFIDEAQHPITEVAFDARSNLQKCPDFKLCAFGNPDSRLTPLGRYSEPITGWESISPEQDGWKTKWGRCHYFDGLKSPAIEDPEKFPFLIGQKHIDLTIEDSGMDSPDYWQFCRGYVTPEGTPLQIISETFAITHHMTELPQWVGDIKIGAGFDPSYSAGGDRRVVVPFKVGEAMWGVTAIAFMEPIDIRIEASKLKDETFARQMVNRVIEHCEALGVEKRLFGMDTTGAQNILADLIDESWDQSDNIVRVEFGGAPSELETRSGKRACDVYANRVTELWYNMVDYAKGNQIRSVPVQALKEFSIRQMLSMDKMRMRTTKRQIEPKPLMKERTGGKSPDEADACVIAVEVVKTRLGVTPGSSGIRQTDHTPEDDWAREVDLDSADDLYLTEAM